MVVKANSQGLHHFPPRYPIFILLLLLLFFEPLKSFTLILDWFSSVRFTKNRERERESSVPSFSFEFLKSNSFLFTLFLFPDFSLTCLFILPYPLFTLFHFKLFLFNSTTNLSSAFFLLCCLFSSNLGVSVWFLVFPEDWSRWQSNFALRIVGFLQWVREFHSHMISLNQMLSQLNKPLLDQIPLVWTPALILTFVFVS